jgi:hypothetical protein
LVFSLAFYIFEGNLEESVEEIAVAPVSLLYFDCYLEKYTFT